MKLKEGCCNRNGEGGQNYREDKEPKSQALIDQCKNMLLITLPLTER